MDTLDLRKRDMTVVYGDRTFLLRAYRHDGAWHGSIIENRIPMMTDRFAATTDAATYFAAAVGFLAAMVDAGVDAVESAV
jgi:hypothetical protein